MSALNHVPCYVYGTDKMGKMYPKKLYTTCDLNATAIEYRKEFPRVVHVCIDVALNYDENS